MSRLSSPLKKHCFLTIDTKLNAAMSWSQSPKRIWESSSSATFIISSLQGVRQVLNHPNQNFTFTFLLDALASPFVNLPCKWSFIRPGSCALFLSKRCSLRQKNQKRVPFYLPVYVLLFLYQFLKGPLVDERSFIKGHF